MDRDFGHGLSLQRVLMDRACTVSAQVFMRRHCLGDHSPDLDPAEETMTETITGNTVR